MCYWSEGVNYFTIEPLTDNSEGETSFKTPSGPHAIKIIPFDSTPLMFRGCKFVKIQTCLPIILSGV